MSASLAVSLAAIAALVQGLPQPLPAPSDASAEPPFQCIVPPSPHPIRVRQPDGRSLELHLRRRGRRIWYEDVEGRPVVEGDGWFVFAETDGGGLRATGHRADGVPPPDLGRSRPWIERDPGAVTPLAELGNPGIGKKYVGARRNRRFETAESVRNLVVLLRFANHASGGQNRTLPTAADIDVIMDAPGGDPVLAPTGSVNDVYDEMSYGKFSLQSTVADWVTVPGTESYYANGGAGLTTRTWELIADGLDLVDAAVDFSQFDEDGDGWVDSITFLHSGYGAEWGGLDQYGTHYTSRIWSHFWEIPTWTSAEGVKVSAYHISPGLWATSGSNPTRIGIIAHETGHFFGLPDLYDRDDTSEGDGHWCLMAHGLWSFNGAQRHPSHFSPWAKVQLGWVEPTRVLPGAYVAPQVETSPTVYLIDSGYPPGEYLLIENRQPTGFDSLVPAGGLAVWHVDEGKGGLGTNTVNLEEGYPAQVGWPQNDYHYRNALLQADGGFDLERNVNRGDGGDLYRSTGVAAVGPFTTPNTDPYQGGGAFTSGNAITGIGPSGSSVPFTYSNSQAPVITSPSSMVAILGEPFSQGLVRSGGTPPFVWTLHRPNPTYALASLGPEPFSFGGAAKNWHADEGRWQLVLPFEFPFYERTYDRLWVSSNGFLDFVPGDAEPDNERYFLRAALRIAPLWDDLRTDLPGDDVFVDTSVQGRIVIRWAAATFATNAPCDFAVTLHSDGRIRFDYGASNADVTPTVGISRGLGGQYLRVDGYDGAPMLSSAHSIEIALSGAGMPPGLSLGTNGTVSGTPTVAGTYAPWVRVSDSSYNYGLQQLSITVGPDCNGNDVPDSIDLGNGILTDLDENGVPDACQFTTLCKPKRDTAGCLAQIGFGGLPTLTGDDDFTVTVGPVVGETTGVLLFGTPGDALPGSFQPTGTTPWGSRVCIRAPQPTASSASGGSLDTCDGTFAFPMGQALLGSLGPAGTTVHAQCIYRDAAQPDGSGIAQSRALEFTLLP